MPETKNFKLSDEALGAVMMALQKSLLEQSDIIPVLKGFNFKIGDGAELYIMNPPIVKFGLEELQEEDLETVGSD